MSDEIEIAFQILGVGMVTVAMVLLLVVGMGKLMITLVNMLPVVAHPVQPSGKANAASAISSQHIAVITAAVAAVSQGKATIMKIEKKN